MQKEDGVDLISYLIRELFSFCEYFLQAQLL